MELSEIEKLTYKFSNNLVDGGFEKAHSQLTSTSQMIWSSSWIKQQYNEMIQYGDGAPTHIEVMQTDPMKGWASFREGDTRIREMEWGRPEMLNQSRQNEKLLADSLAFFVCARRYESLNFDNTSIFL